MISILKNNNPLLLAFVVIIAALLQVNTGLGNFNPTGFENAPFLSQLIFTGFITNLNYYAIAGVCFLLSVILSIEITLINTKFEITGKKNFSPTFFFLFIAFSVPSSSLMLEILASAVLIFAGIYSLLNVPKSKLASPQYFNASFLLSCSSFFYINSIFISPILLISFFTIRSFSGKEFMASILGLLTPFFFYISIQFLVSDNIDFSMFTLLSKSVIQAPLSGNMLAFLGSIVLILLASIAILIRVFPQLNLNVRRKNSFFISILIIPILVYLISPSASYELLVLASFPLSFILSIFFTYSKKRIVTEIVFFLFLILFILSQTKISIPYISTIF